MADRQGPMDRLGGFELGASHEAGPGVGRLREARHVDTGKPGLVLQPDEHVQWPFEGGWKVRVTSQVNPPALILEIEEAPASASPSELADLLVLVATALQRVENNPQVQAHLLGGPVGARARARPAWRPRGLAAVAGLAVLGLGLSWCLAGAAQRPVSGVSTVAFTGAARIDAPDSVSSNGMADGVVAYPMPSEPFRNQAKGPCLTKSGEVEINGGCWMALEKRPPCYERHAEHLGKCYMPINKDRGEVPRAARP